MSIKRSKDELTQVEKDFTHYIDIELYSEASDILDDESNKDIANLKFKFDNTDKPILLLKRLVDKFPSAGEHNKKPLLDLMIKMSNLTSFIDALSLSLYPEIIKNGTELADQLIQSGHDVNLVRMNKSPLSRICNILENEEHEEKIDLYKPIVNSLLQAGANIDIEPNSKKRKARKPSKNPKALRPSVVRKIPIRNRLIKLGFKEIIETLDQEKENVFEQNIIDGNFYNALQQLKKYPEYKYLKVEGESLQTYIIVNFENYNNIQQPVAAELLLSLNESSKDNFIAAFNDYPKEKLLILKPILKVFIEAGTNIDTTVPLQIDTLRTNFLNAGITVEELNEWDAELTPEEKTERLFNALSEGVHADQIKHLHEDNINAVNKENGKTPLHFALLGALQSDAYDDTKFSFLTYLLENGVIDSVSVEDNYGVKPFFTPSSDHNCDKSAKHFVTYCNKNYDFLKDNNLLEPLIDHFVTDFIVPTRTLSYSNIDYLNKFKNYVENDLDADDKNKDSATTCKAISKILFEKINDHAPKEDSVSNEFTQAILDGEYETASVMLSSDKSLAKQWIKSDCNISVKPIWIIASESNLEKRSEAIDLLIQFNKHLSKGEVLNSLSDHNFLKYHGVGMLKKYINAAGLKPTEIDELIDILKDHIEVHTKFKDSSLLHAIRLEYKELGRPPYLFDCINNAKPPKEALTQYKTLREATQKANNVAKFLTQDEPDLVKAMEIIDTNTDLAYKTIRFKDTNVQQSVPRFLTQNFPTFKRDVQKNIVSILERLNELSPENQAYDDVNHTINQLTVRDKNALKAFKPLLDLMNPPSEELSLNPKSEESVTEESEASSANNLTQEVSVEDDGQAPSDEISEDLPTKIVEETIIKCLENFNNEDFNFDETVNKLVRDTMGYAKTITFEQLPDIIENIEETYEFADAKDPAWQDFRHTIGEIVNKTADHYIEENARVDKTQKLLMLCCLTVIGAIIPLLYYLLKVKPTHAASPLAVYEMSINKFNTLTEEKNPAADDISHDDVSDFVSQGGGTHLMWPSLIDRRESDENQARLTNNDNDQANLEPTVLFNTKSEHSDRNGDLFNGALATKQFVNKDLEVRWIALRGEQAKHIEETLEALKEENDQDFKTVIGAAAG